MRRGEVLPEGTHLRIGSIWLWCVCFGVASAADPPAGAQSAREALERLRLGNQAYVAAQFDPARNGAARRAELAGGQHPFATVLSCADSRVPPETIFNQGLGDLFVVRVAGAVAGQTVLGSIEYAAEHLHVPLVVVMGHSSCGAVKAAMETPPPAKPDPAGVNLERILSAIRPSLPRALSYGDQWANAVYASVEQNIGDVIRLSPVLAEMGEAGKVILVGAFYDLNSGKVHFSEPVVFRRRSEQVSGGRSSAPVSEAHR